MEDEDGVENNGDYQGTSSLSSSEGGKLVGGANQEMMMFSTQQPLVGGENPAITEVEPELPPKSDEWETIQYVGTSTYIVKVEDGIETLSGWLLNVPYSLTPYQLWCTFNYGFIIGCLKVLNHATRILSGKSAMNLIK